MSKHGETTMKDIIARTLNAIAILAVMNIGAKLHAQTTLDTRRVIVHPRLRQRLPDQGNCREALRRAQLPARLPALSLGTADRRICAATERGPDGLRRE